MFALRRLREDHADLGRRYAEVVAERDAANKAADTERFNVKRLAGQVTEARDETDALREKQAAERPTPGTELRRARRELMLERRIVAQLNDRLEALQAANEAMCREAVDRAGTLTAGEVAAP